MEDVLVFLLFGKDSAVVAAVAAEVLAAEVLVVEVFVGLEEAGLEEEALIELPGLFVFVVAAASEFEAEEAGGKGMEVAGIHPDAVRTAAFAEEGTLVAV